MTQQQIETINSMLARDISEAKIARTLGVSGASLRGYLFRHPELRRNLKRCRFCGKIVPQTPHKREKQFCSDTCRMAFWNARRPTKKPRKIKVSIRYLLDYPGQKSDVCDTNSQRRKT